MVQLSEEQQRQLGEIVSILTELRNGKVDIEKAAQDIMGTGFYYDSHREAAWAAHAIRAERNCRLIKLFGDKFDKLTGLHSPEDLEGSV